jgi:hypothetical protein
LIQEKVWYLNQFDFILRSILFFVIWLIIAYMMSMQHRKAKGDPSFKLPRTWYGLGIILYVLTITFAAFDWLMSLEPIFYSTIFGLIILVGQLGSAFALSILMVTFFPSLSGFVLSPDRRTIHDLGNFLLMSVMLWAYMSFSQLLLIWSGQLPDEIIFYNYRFYGGWNIFGIILIILHFAIPFFLLLFRKIKQAALASASIAGVLLVSRWMDLVWQVQPNFSPAEISIPWLMIVVPIAFIGIWLASFFTVLDRMTYG